MEGDLSVHCGHISALLHAAASLPEVGKGLKPCDTDLVLPLIIIPADLHQVPLTHQPSPNNSAVDSLYSFVLSSKPV